MQKRRHVVMLPSPVTPPVDDLAVLILKYLADGQHIILQPVVASGRVLTR